MYNWSTDEKYLKKFPKEYEKWRLLQLINYGLDGEKLDIKKLKKRWEEIKTEILNPKVREYLQRFVIMK